jgi:hypothetical protein
MVSLNIVLDRKYEPDTEGKLDVALDLLAEMVVNQMGEAERDGKLAPADIPRETSGQSSSTQNTAIIDA